MPAFVLTVATETTLRQYLSAEENDFPCCPVHIHCNEQVLV